MKNIAIGIAVIGTLLGTPALGADMPVKAPPVAPPPGCVWCGWYIGGNVGYGWGESTDPNLSFVNPGNFGNIGGFLTGGVFPPATSSGNLFPALKPSGALGGVQIGYDHQINNWVLGTVADIQAAGWSAASTVTTPAATTGANANETLGANVRWFGTVRAKAGMAFSNVLLYGTGGLAYGRVAENIGFACTPGGVGCGGIDFLGSSATLRAGWTAGTGIELKVSTHVSFGLEYLHVDLGRSSVTAYQAAIPTTTITESQRIANDFVRATVDYHF